MLIGIYHHSIENSFNADVRSKFDLANTVIKNQRIEFGNLIGNGNKCVVALLFEIPIQNTDLTSLMTQLSSKEMYPWGSILANAYAYKKTNKYYVRYEDGDWKKIEYKKVGETIYFSDDIFQIYAEHKMPSLDSESYIIVVLDYTDSELDTLNMACN